LRCCLCCSRVHLLSDLGIYRCLFYCYFLKGSLCRCPGCGRLEEMHALDFRPPVEFARFALEISELVFTDAPPRLDPHAKLIREIANILGCELKPTWYRI